MKVKELFYSYFLPILYAPEASKVSAKIHCLPMQLVEAICLLIESFIFISKLCKNINSLRPFSTNDVENYFSFIKQIVGRDGREVRAVSAIEMHHGVRKTTWCIQEQL